MLIHGLPAKQHGRLACHLKMGRAALLALGITCLVAAVHGQQDITECVSAECAWMDEKICPGKFFPEEPSAGMCCATCVVIMEGGKACRSTHPGYQIVCRNPYTCQDGVCTA